MEGGRLGARTPGVCQRPLESLEDSQVHVRHRHVHAYEIASSPQTDSSIRWRVLQLSVISSGMLLHIANACHAPEPVAWSCQRSTCMTCSPSSAWNQKRSPPANSACTAQLKRYEHPWIAMPGICLVVPPVAQTV